MGETKRRVTVRLYRQHDMDLITLYRTEGFRFQKMMKLAASAAARGERLSIAIPRGKMAPGYVARSYSISLYLSPEEDGELLSMLGAVKPGLRCGFLKALMRRSLSAFPMSAYIKGDGLILSVGGRPDAGDEEKNEMARNVLAVPDSAYEKERKTRSRKKKRPEPVVDAINLAIPSPASLPVSQAPGASPADDIPAGDGQGTSVPQDAEDAGLVVDRAVRVPSFEGVSDSGRSPGEENLSGNSQSLDDLMAELSALNG